MAYCWLDGRNFAVSESSARGRDDFFLQDIFRHRLSEQFGWLSDRQVDRVNNNNSHHPHAVNIQYNLITLYFRAFFLH